MRKKEVIKILRNAYSRAVPAYNPDTENFCPDRVERSIEMTVNNNAKFSKAVKIAVIAAAAIALLTVTAAAIGFSKVIGEKEALGIAETYVIKNTDDKILVDQISEALISGYVYGDSVGQGQADLGLKEGRLVYSVTFKTCGYAFNVSVDAKTGVVYSCDRTDDPDWETKKAEFDKNPPELPKQSDTYKVNVDGVEMELERIVLPDDATYTISAVKAVFSSWFGLNETKFLDEVAGVIVNSTETDSVVKCTMSVDGYVYSAKVDCYTGEVTDPSVTEDENWQGERILHERDENTVLYSEARDIAEKAYLEMYPELSECEGIYVRTIALSDASDSKYLKYDGEEIYGQRLLHVFFSNRDQKSMFTDVEDDIEIDAVINADTGEVIEIVKKLGFGSLNKIAQQAAGFEPKGASMTSDAHTTTAELKDDDGNITVVVIDTVTGEVLSVSRKNFEEGMTPNYKKNCEPSTDSREGEISEAVAAAVALDNSGVSINDVNALSVTYSGGIFTVTFNYGSVDYFNDVYCVNTYRINAKTGEIVDSDAITPDSLISQEDALKTAEEYFRKDYDYDGEIEVIENNSKIFNYTPLYEITLKGGGKTSSYTLDAVNGTDIYVMH